MPLNIAPLLPHSKRSADLGFALRLGSAVGQVRDGGNVSAQICVPPSLDCWCVADETADCSTSRERQIAALNRCRSQVNTYDFLEHCDHAPHGASLPMPSFCHGTPSSLLPSLPSTYTSISLPTSFLPQLPPSSTTFLLSLPCFHVLHFSTPPHLTPHIPTSPTFPLQLPFLTFLTPTSRATSFTTMCTFLHLLAAFPASLSTHFVAQKLVAAGCCSTCDRLLSYKHLVTFHWLFGLSVLAGAFYISLHFCLGGLLLDPLSSRYCHLLRHDNGS